ncbi:MAG: zf-TFIIB domain-containing protein [Deltaproteobacteria bacterium]|nr:zf-TFIIB domain-containing protein [Deltaproteobacteria bacterium]
MYRDEFEHCPACATELVTAGDRRACHGCGGIWMREATLTELVHDMQNGAESSGLRFAPRRGGDPRVCPVCHQPMDRVAVEGVAVERCGRGDGVWLDAGELATALYNASQRPPRAGFDGAPVLVLPTAQAARREAPRPIAAPPRPSPPRLDTPEPPADVLVHHVTLAGQVYRFDSAAMMIAPTPGASARFGLQLARGIACVWLTGDAIPSPAPGESLLGILAFDPVGLDRLATLLLDRPATLRPIVGDRLEVRARWSATEVAAWIEFPCELVEDGRLARDLPPAELGFIARVVATDAPAD